MTAATPPYLVYHVSRSDNKRWCYKLLPVNFADKMDVPQVSNLSPRGGPIGKLIKRWLPSGVSPGPDKWDSPGKKLDEIQGGITCEEDGEGLLACIPELAAYLRTSLQKCYEQTELRQLSFSFRDELFLRQPDQTDLYKAAVDIRVNSGDSTNHAWAVYVLFASLSLCFSDTSESTSVIRVYTAWQRYNLIKKLYRPNLEHSKDKASLTEQDIKDILLANEFASSHRALANLLLDETNSYACRILWKEGYRQKKSIDEISDKLSPWKKIRKWLSCWGQVGDNILDPQIRHRLRLSMYVERAFSSSASGLTVSGYDPLPAPGCFESNTQLQSSRSISLHPRFQERTGQAAVRRFIHGELLPQYNLNAALSLVRLMRFGQRGKFWGCIGWATRYLIIPASVFGAFVFMLILLIGCSFDFGWINYWLGWMLFLAIGGSGLVFLSGFIGLGAGSGIDLLLPRVAGGIALGYFPLLMGTEPWYLAVYLSGHHFGWLLEWLVVWVIAGTYIYREAFPSVLQTWKALQRSSKVLVWATAQAVLIGFFLILFATPVYQQAKYDAQRLNSQPSANAPAKLLFLRLDTTTLANNREKSVAELLDYYVDVPLLLQIKFPVSALLTFAPISLLLGIILQILWEEKPVTASVWPSESR